MVRTRSFAEANIETSSELVAGGRKRDVSDVQDAVRYGVEVLRFGVGCSRHFAQLCRVELLSASGNDKRASAARGEGRALRMCEEQDFARNVEAALKFSASFRPVARQTSP